ncbi:MAG TPA: M48 family metalloprotease [Abditibacterium sp.]|jgi:Zn-dependent protease with chaperone function
MQKSNITLGGALLLAGFVATATTPVAHAQFGKISEAEEIQAGRQSAAQAIKEYGPPLPASDPRAQRVARIGAMFAAQSTRRNIPYSYTVLRNDTVLNAFAAPGGPIFVTTKLVATASNDAELAYVLGHETAHIERKHIVNQVAKQQKVGLGVGILGAILGRGRNNQAASVVGGLVVAGLSSKYSRADEDDSDSYGVRAMARLGFDPRAAVSMLGKLGGGNTSGLSKFLASHPSPKSRQSKVNELIREENLLQVAQRAGGARLSLSGNDTNIYRPTTAYPNSGSTSSDGNASLDAPLRVVNSGQYRVILAPVASLARSVGGVTRVENDDIVFVGRGNNSLRMRLGGSDAILNGRQVRLSASPRLIDNRFYAPLGTVVAGLGGTATYDGARGAVRVDFDGRSGYLDLP